MSIEFPSSAYFYLGAKSTDGSIDYYWETSGIQVPPPESPNSHWANGNPSDSGNEVKNSFIVTYTFVKYLLLCRTVFV